MDRAPENALRNLCTKSTMGRGAKLDATLRDFNFTKVFINLVAAIIQIVFVSENLLCSPRDELTFGSYFPYEISELWHSTELNIVKFSYETQMRELLCFRH